jgi:uncharacterized protein YlxW (UPF0749 family)
MSEHGAAPRWDSTAHGPVRRPPYGPVHATYSPRPGYNRGAIPLLDLITQQSLDEDYLHVAERRRAEEAAAADAGETAGPMAGETRARAGRRRWLTLAVVLAFGLIVTVAAVQTSRNASVENASKDQLISRIDARRHSLAALQQQIADLRESNTRQDAAYGDLGRELSSVTGTQQALLATTGWKAVSGEGVRARLDDAPGGSSDGQVRDSDLAGLVNGLLQAGATAVSVNGQRVTNLSSLRNTASAVRINGISLSPPYTVVALGDTDTMQARFAQTTSGMRLRNLVRTFGMPFTMDNDSNLTVPAAPRSMLALRHARTDHGPMQDKEMQ